MVFVIVRRFLVCDFVFSKIDLRDVSSQIDWSQILRDFFTRVGCAIQIFFFGGGDVSEVTVFAGGPSSDGL